MKEGKYTKTLAKIQVGTIFTCEISREMLICLIYRASETPCLSPSEWHQHGGRYICYPVLAKSLLPYTKKECWKLPDLSIKYIGQSKMTFLIFIFTVNIMTSFPRQNR